MQQFTDCIFLFTKDIQEVRTETPSNSLEFQVVDTKSHPWKVTLYLRLIYVVHYNLKKYSKYIGRSVQFVLASGLFTLSSELSDN